ncbi:MAG: hypothetical protein M3295_02555 [Chloroflexota bacterium]|nr:hypothetical protein [Chloroflexota bacterium]
MPLTIAGVVLAACPSPPPSASQTPAATVKASVAASEVATPVATESVLPPKTPDETAAQTEGPSQTEAGDYQSITDEQSVLFMSVPKSWTDVRSGGWTFDGQDVGLSLTASTDVDQWYEGYDVDGAFFAASTSLADQYSPEELLDQYDLSGDCTLDHRADYSDPAYTGMEDIYTDCGGGDTQFSIIAASPEDNSFLVLVQTQVATDEGFAAYQNILNTFVVIDPEGLP